MRRPFQITIIIILMIAAALLYWFASHTLEPWILVRKTASGALVSVKGWKIAAELWPVMLTGAIPAFVILAAAGTWALYQAEEADHEAEIRKLYNETNAALKRAEKAESVAEKKYRDLMLEAEKTRHEAAESIRIANLKHAEACQTIKTANETIARIQAEATEKVQENEYRRKNAAATAERRRRKLEKAEQEKEQQELNKFFRS